MMATVPSNDHGPDVEIDEADPFESAGVAEVEAMYADGAPANGGASRVRIDDDAEWRSLILTKRKQLADGTWRETVQPTIPNIVTFFRYHPAWRGVVGWDAFAERIVTLAPPSWDVSVSPVTPACGPWQETDDARAVDWLARHEGINVSPKLIAAAIPVVAEANRVHPVETYLRSLRWDGKKRLDTWLATYCGVEASAYASEVGRRWMISAVARPLRPGCQVDCMLILESHEQGTGKSSAFRALASPAFYSETGITIGDKDSYQALHGMWIFLFDELDSLRRADLTKTKNFLTATKDHYRPSYGRVTRDFLRQNVFCGTTNASQYLTDPTGNRRFWPVRVVRAIDVEAIVRDRDQLWAEAVARFDSGERWHVDTPELRAMCEAEQRDRVQADDWEIVIGRWLADPRERAQHDTATATGAPFAIPASGVLTADILTHAIGKPPGAMARADTMHVAEVLRTLGYERGPQHRENGVGVRRYVRQASPPSPPEPPTDLRGGDDDTSENEP